MGDIRIMNKMENKRIRHGIILSALILCVCAVMFSVSSFQKSVFAETVPEMVKINKSVSIKVLDSAQLEEGVDSTAIRFTGNVLNNCFENGVLKQNYSVGMLLVREKDFEGHTSAELEVGGNTINNVINISISHFGKESDSYVPYNVALYNIPSTDCATNIVAKAYVFDGTE